MLARVLSAALVGVEAALVRVEVDITSGLPAFTTVGLPDSAVRESRERVRSAIRNAGYAFPSDRITVNLAPADLRKEGASFDLPIALGILAATGSVKPDAIGPFAVVGELALDGQIHAVRGTLAVGLACRRKSIPTIVVPAGNRAEAQAVEGLRVLGASTLRDAVALLNGEATAVLPPAPAAIAAPVSDDLDLADVRGQAHAKRALEIAAAGNHNLLLVGAPGTGQTMYHRPTNAKLCPHFPGILDPRIAPVVARCPRCERPTTRTSILPFLGILGSCLGPVASGEPGEAPLPVWLRAGDPVTAPPLLPVPRYVHGHQNRRGYWRVLQLREAGYLTVSEVAKALGIGRPPRCGGGREPSIPGQPGSVGSGSITRPTSNCSDAGSKCRQRQPTGNSPSAAQRRLRRATPNTISSLGQASVRMLTEIGCGGWI